MEKPRLYLSLDQGKLTIVKAKCWAQRTKDPHGLTTHFKVIDGCVIEVTRDWE